MVGMLMLSIFKNAGAIPTMAGMLMLSGVGKMNFKKAVLVGALQGGLRISAPFIFGLNHGFS